MEHLSGGLLKGRLLASPTNIRLGWKGLPRANTLAYYINYSRKKIYSSGPWTKSECTESLERHSRKLVDTLKSRTSLTFAYRIYKLISIN